MIRYSLFFILFSIIACNSNTISKKETPVWHEKYDKVMEIHDAVMPEVSTINKLQRQLQALLNTQPNILFSDQRNRAEEIIRRLAKAEEGMFVWMRSFKQPTEGDKGMTEEIIAYLDKEEIAITKVSNDMISSIQDATNLIAEIKANPK